MNRMWARVCSFPAFLFKRSLIGLPSGLTASLRRFAGRAGRG